MHTGTKRLLVFLLILGAMTLPGCFGPDTSAPTALPSVPVQMPGGVPVGNWESTDGLHLQIMPTEAILRLDCTMRFGRALGGANTTFPQSLQLDSNGHFGAQSQRIVWPFAYSPIFTPTPTIINATTSPLLPTMDLAGTTDGATMSLQISVRYPSGVDYEGRTENYGPYHLIRNSPIPPILCTPMA